MQVSHEAKIARDYGIELALGCNGLLRRKRSHGSSQSQMLTTRYTGAIRQPVKLVGPGVSPEEVAAVFGITPERQAFIRELLRPYREANARQNGAKTKRTERKTAGRKSASRK